MAKVNAKTLESLADFFDSEYAKIPVNWKDFAASLMEVAEKPQVERLIEDIEHVVKVQGADVVMSGLDPDIAHEIVQAWLRKKEAENKAWDNEVPVVKYNVTMNFGPPSITDYRVAPTAFNTDPTKGDMFGNKMNDE